MIVMPDIAYGFSDFSDEETRRSLRRKAPHYVLEIASMKFGEAKEWISIANELKTFWMTAPYLPQRVKDDSQFIKWNSFVQQDIKISGFMYNTNAWGCGGGGCRVDSTG